MKLLPPASLDESGITVTFLRSANAVESATLVIFRIPDRCQILSRDPEEFMRWCYREMMTIGRQAREAK